MLVAKLAQFPQEAWRRGTDPAFALNRFGQDGTGLRTDRGLRRLEIAERNRVEALDPGTEASRCLGLPAAAIVASVRP